MFVENWEVKNDKISGGLKRFLRFGPLLDSMYLCEFWSQFSNLLGDETLLLRLLCPPL